MSVNLPNHYVREYATNVELQLQQKGSKLRPFVTTGMYVGDQASPVDQIDSVEAQQVTTRFGAMPRVDAATARRWVFPVDYDLPQLIDKFDKLRMLTDPESMYVQNALNALGRKMDYEIINAFTGTAKTGVSGATSTSFTAGNEVDVATGGSNSRLNVAKLHAVKELIRAAHIDPDEDPCYVGLTAKDESALLKEIQLINKDYGADAPVLRDGKLTRFLGLNFVYCELIESVAAGTNEVDIPVWARSGMHLGIWGDIRTEISQRNDLQGTPWQAYLYMTIGATRLDEEKVFNIESYRA
jgi:hypothetical protein